MYVTAGVTDIRAAGDSSPPNDEFEPPSSHASSSRRLSLLDCPTPNTFFYDAEFELTSYYALDSGGCSSSERAYLIERMYHHFNEYSFYTKQLGAIEVTPCQSTAGRRQLLAAGNETTNRNLSEADGKHRNLMYRYRIVTSHSGKCSDCGPDNSDNRRNLVAGIEPITVTVKTDEYPEEMELQITTLDNEIVYSHSNFGYEHARKTLFLYLAAGQEYKVKMRDSYGDGWCCEYGGGNVRMYAGYDESGKQIGSWHSDFETEKIVRFTVPYSLTGRSYGIDAGVDSFMQLSDDISRYESYYIQQEFHNDRNSCLHHKFPEVTVTLTPANPIPEDEC